MNRRDQVFALRYIIREEIGRNFKTLANDPVQYYNTSEAHYEIFPVEGGWQVEIEVPGRPDLTPPIRKFPTEQEAILYGRHWFEKLMALQNKE